MSARFIVPTPDLISEPIGERDACVSILSQFIEQVARWSIHDERAGQCVFAKVVGDYGQGKTHMLRYIRDKLADYRKLAPALVECAFLPYRGLSGLRRSMVTEANALGRHAILKALHTVSGDQNWPSEAFEEIHGKVRELRARDMKPSGQRGNLALIHLLAGEIRRDDVRELAEFLDIDRRRFGTDSEPEEWIASLIALFCRAGKTPVILVDELAQVEIGDPTGFMRGMEGVLEHLHVHSAGCAWIFGLTPQAEQWFELEDERRLRDAPARYSLQGCRDVESARAFCRQVDQSLPPAYGDIQVLPDGFEVIHGQANRNWRDLVATYQSVLLQARLSSERVLDAATVRRILDSPTGRAQPEDAHQTEAAWIPPFDDEPKWVTEFPHMEEQFGGGTYWNGLSLGIDLLALGHRYCPAAITLLGLAQIRALRDLALVALQIHGARALSAADVVGRLQGAGWLDSSDPGWWPLRLIIHDGIMESDEVYRIFTEGLEVPLLRLALDKTRKVEAVLTDPARLSDPRPV